MIKEVEHRLIVQRITARKDVAEERVGVLEARIKRAETYLRQALETNIPDWKQWYLWQIADALDMWLPDVIAGKGSQPPVQKSPDFTHFAE